MRTSIDPRLAVIALDNAKGTDFEKFFHAFFPEIAGIDFVPLGGIKDGGADAFQGEGIFSGNRTSRFYQASIQKDHRAKIRQTVARLKEFGRDPQNLVYVTSRQINTADRDEESLSDELGISISIRNRDWIVGNINKSATTIAAFNAYLLPAVSFLQEIGGTRLISSSNQVSDRAVCVFLGQEVDRRRGKSDLLESVTDTLVLWALEGTDPDQGIFRNRKEILKKIEHTLPSAKHFIRGVIDHRLRVLSSKSNVSGREVKYHSKEDAYCLPYETRLEVEAENRDDEFLLISVRDGFEARAEDLLEDESDVSAIDVARLALKSIELTFQKEGLELAAFIDGEESAEFYTSIADHVDVAIEDAGVVGSNAVVAKTVCMNVLRRSFYESTVEERRYFGKLSRTYTLLFSLQAEPRIVEYFKEMTSNFSLFVGSDIVVRALSENFLHDEDRMTANMLKILTAAGSELVLTEMALEEVYRHLQTSDFEFQNDFLGVEPYVTPDIARHSGKILIRAYFYAKLGPVAGQKPPAGWKSYVGQFCTYENLHGPSGKRELAGYLTEKFGFTFASREELENLVEDKDELRTLHQSLLDIKSNDVLAQNDALHVLAVYGKRRKLGEETRANPYGYRVWWLTHESKVRAKTGPNVGKRGSQYIMRPEFILNFIALSPSAREVREAYETIFPSLLGIRLSNRMREEIFRDVMKRANEVRQYDEARLPVMMGDLSTRLKGDHFKQYEAEFNSQVR